MMSQENEQQTKQPEMTKKQREEKNNANTVKNAADVAMASKNPYAMAAGGAVKAADKLTGGQASEQLGKALRRSNKFSPVGRRLQRASNMLAESGLGDRIGQAASMKNGMQGATLGAGENASSSTTSTAASTAVNKSGIDETASDKEAEEQEEEKVTGQFLVRMPLYVKLIIFVGILPAACFVLVFIAIVVNYVADEKAFGVFAGQATGTDADEFKNELINHRDEFGFGLGDDDELGMGNMGPTYNEFLSRYENITNVYNYFDCGSIEECLKLDEVKFFIKVNDIGYRYKAKYGILLDWQLLMSTVFSMDMDPKETYAAFWNEYSEDDVKDLDKTMNLDWEYDYKNIPGYTYLDGNNYEYDLQILAKNMVQKTTVQTCRKATGTDEAGNTLYTETKSQTDYDIENKYFEPGAQYYLKCDAGEIYSISHVYSKNLDKYHTFLLEYLEHKIFLNLGSSSTRPSAYRCTAENFPTYDLTEEQLLGIASQAYHEQGTPKGAAAEASLMANRFELYGSSYGNGADGLYNYVRKSGWFAHSAQNMDSHDAPDEVVEAVRSVLVDGKRTLPAYIDEHDWINDLTSVSNDGKAFSKNDRESYEQNKTIIKNKYGATYTFYSFPDSNSDPFGYTSEAKREELGDYHYDFDSGEPINCSGSGEYLFPLPEGSTSCRTSAYGWRVHPITHENQFHSGDDYGAAGGTPVYAVADGVVSASGRGCVVGNMNCNGGMGNYVIIDHEGGIQSIYMHATTVYVNPGDKVQKGDVIMTVGTTGSSTGNHLHITFKKDGVRDDPANYIGAMPMCY